MTASPALGRNPIIIQGGMGVGISGWPLARAVSKLGQLGVVSGTALDVVLARRLQVGDPGGHIRRALAHFPFPSVAQRILDRYFLPDGKPVAKPFRPKPLLTERAPARQAELLIAANFAEVFLAREGHDRPVGINYLEKIQLPTLPSLYGAMLAGVGYVLMGAGIPRAIPGILDMLADNQLVELRIDVKGSTGGTDEPFIARFDPASVTGGASLQLTRPHFIAIISSAPLATMLARKSSGGVDGFVVERHVAGGHNAPPRGRMQLSIAGEPVYGERDAPDLSAIRELGLPFWLAGSYAEPHRIAEALDLGAAGVQVGTAFAYCDESGLDPELKARALQMSRAGEARIFTDPVASPTGFPFKVVQMEGTLSEPPLAEARERICDLGYLREAYRKPDGQIGWRCSAEPVDDYLRKGGALEDTVGRKCICNALLATIGLGQVRAGGQHELPLLTSGDDVATVARFLKPGATTYTAADVVDALLAQVAGATQG
jgi:NAD(P)H-dependent flavin oxidoreductase YrpB (nitropropane dioxygenase family)